MNPNHDSLTPSRTTKSQSLTPHFALIPSNTLNLLALLLFPTLDILEVARNPLLLTTLVHELHAVLLECRHGIQSKLAIGGNQLRRTRDDHRRDGFVSLQELFNQLRGHGDEMGFDILGVLNDGFRINH